jgi:hypothetical protein
MRFAFILLALVVGCDGCGPTQQDFLGCAAACSPRGVATVTWDRCTCNAACPACPACSASDAGAR